MVTYKYLWLSLELVSSAIVIVLLLVVEDLELVFHLVVKDLNLIHLIADTVLSTLTRSHPRSDVILLQHDHLVRQASPLRV